MADFCVVADVENFLQLTIPADKLASAERAISEASAAIRNYCHQYIELVADEEITLDCKGGTRLFLPELPVVSVASVEEDGEPLVEGADEDYQLGQWGILHRVGQDWVEGIQIVTIVYTHGYAEIPDDVVGVCTRAAARAYQAGLKAAEMSGVAGITSLSLGDYAVGYGSEGTSEGVMGASAARMLLLSEKDMLDNFRYVMQ